MTTPNNEPNGCGSAGQAPANGQDWQQPDAGQPQGSTYSYMRDQLREVTSGPVADVTQPQPAARPAQQEAQAGWTSPAATQPQQPAAAQPQYTVNPAVQQVHAQQSWQAAAPAGGFAPDPAPSPSPAPTGCAGGGNGKGSKPKRHVDRGSLKTFGLGFAGAAVACALVLGGNALLHSGNVAGVTTVIGGSGSQITAQDTSKTLAEQVSSKCLPSVVSIDVYVKQSQSGYFGISNGSETMTESSLGSGVVLTQDGYIVTNYHVIEGFDALKVTIEGEEYDAELVGSDESSDIAVIKAKNASGLTPMDIGDSDALTVGEWVMSIGSPFGLEQSVATGIVSATSRSQIMSAEDGYGSGSYTMYPNMIQTDAAINPGNSGGALVNAQGQLIGINTMITSYSGNYSGVGFAIPVNYALNLAQQIMEGKTPTHAQLGVTLSSVDQSTAQRYGFAVSEGAYISSVGEGTGAAKAGLQVGDIVTKFNETKIASASDLMLAVRSQKVGSVATVEFYRDGKAQTAEVTLGSDEASVAEAQKQQEQQQEQYNGQRSYSQEELEELFNRYFGEGFGF